MVRRNIKGNNQKIVYRNERFNKGVITTNDPLQEGSFRRLINFEISNQNASLQHREPFITVPLYDLQGKEIFLSKNSIVFSFNEETEYSYIIDFKQEVKTIPEFIETILIEPEEIEKFYVVDGDTISVNGQRYRLAFIDAPELEDFVYKPFDNDFKTLGEEAKSKVEEILSKKNFSIVQYDFQSEKKDQFGRPLVFVFYKEEDEIKLLNSVIMEEGYANFYGIYNVENFEVTIPKEISFKNKTYNLFNLFKTAFDTAKNKELSPINSKYFAVNIDFNLMENYFYSKLVVYKIKKETDLKIQQTEYKEYDLKKYGNKIVKRVLETFEINELETKKDLNLFSEENLKYTLITKEHIVLNSKYENQTLNLFLEVHKANGTHLYTGPIEITRTSPNYEEGIFETFNIKTYKNPEMHVEFQNLTNYKPNILSERSIIPELLLKEKSNIAGNSTPKVDAVLLSTFVSENYNKTIDVQSTQFKKYLNSNTARFTEIDKYIIEPFFKAPILKNGKDNYMYRWDLISMKELDLNKEDNIEDFNPIYKSAWTDLYSGENITNNINRLEKKLLNIDKIKEADELYIITFNNFDNYKNDDDEETLPDININNLKIGGDTITEVHDLFIEKIKGKNSFELSLLITNKFNQNYEIIKAYDQVALKAILTGKKEKDKLTYEEPKHQRNKALTEKELEELFENKENKNIGFVFLPSILNFYDETNSTYKSVFNAIKTTTIFFELNSNNKKTLPLHINFNHLKELETKFNNDDFETFFKDGFAARFYLLNYDGEIADLTYSDEHYDVIAYTKTSPTYLFKDGNIQNYLPSDFMKENFEKESMMIKYCKYITDFQDRAIVYGNPMYNNAIFMSEEGSPYYYSLYNTFEFDHEVVHVQQFKTILLVFTINDIWVIYEVEEKEQQEYRDEEGKTQYQEITKLSFRSKKILYNISTEHKNKNTIQNISRYVTLLSNDVLYLIKPSTFISDETQFTLNILSQNISALIKDPIIFINERLLYYGINTPATDYKLNLNATDNNIKLYFSTVVEETPYTLILTYDILNNRWYEEDTIVFGYPEQIYLLDATTKYEMLTNNNGKIYITYQTDKYKNMLMTKYGESYFDISHDENNFIRHSIKYYIDTGNLKLNEHLRKRFRTLHVTMKNIDSKDLFFTYNFQVDDIMFKNNFVPQYKLNEDNIYVEAQVIERDIIVDEKSVFSAGFLDDFYLDFSNFSASDIMVLRNDLLGNGRVPRVKIGFTSQGRFYLLSFGILYIEKGGR